MSQLYIYIYVYRPKMFNSPSWYNCRNYTGLDNWKDSLTPQNLLTYSCNKCKGQAIATESKHKQAQGPRSLPYTAFQNPFSIAKMHFIFWLWAIKNVWEIAVSWGSEKISPVVSFIYHWSIVNLGCVIS